MDRVAYIDRIKHVNNELDRLISEAFRNDQKILECRTRGLKNVLNRDPLTPVYLASYCDYQLKKGLKSDLKNSIDQGDQSEGVFKLIVYVVELLDNKDTFLQSYK